MSSQYDERDISSGAIVMRQQKSTLRSGRARDVVDLDFSQVLLPIWKAKEKSGVSEDKWILRANPNVNGDTSVAIVKLAKAGSFFISEENRIA